MPELAGTAVTIFGVHYAPETTGNAPYTTAMAESLAEAGASVRVITGVPHYPQWKILDQRYRRGLRWRERRNGVELTRVRHAVPATPNLLGRARLELTFLVQCVVAAVRDQSDVLVAVTPTLSGLGAAILCRRGRPVGVLIQDLTGASAAESGTSSGRVGDLIGRIEYWLLKRVDRIGIITPRFGTILTANGIDPDKLVDLPNFTHVTPVAASAPDARRRLGWAEQFTVVHTGNMGMKQGLEAVVEAAQLAEAQGLATQFVLVGDGNQRVALEQLSAGCTNLHFVDPLSADDYPYALAAADVLVVCERRGVREMSLPSKLTSYTVAGRPIVAAVESDGITAETLNRHGSALLCHSGDPAALLEAVHTIMSSQSASDLLTVNAKLLHRNQYGAEGAFARYRGFIEGLAALAAPETFMSASQHWSADCGQARPGWRRGSTTFLRVKSSAQDGLSRSTLFPLSKRDAFATWTDSIETQDGPR